MSKFFAFLLLLAFSSFAVAQNANARRNYRVLNVGDANDASGKGKGGSKGGSSGKSGSKGGMSGKSGSKGEASGKGGKGTKKAAGGSKSSKKMKKIVDEMQDMVFGSMSM
eukprot:CAMPEP_0113609128 /NCGR_PEP_ID=MMETSP0017_2-20120614/4312_1 /TAXON_ID=2856 /ORGANISM="Cylindrotheca closterium" /LENGTH=109 /DNA_ID=CAMNT_0000517897 /DNA_START=33 /DNA_END=362 /DNA_ORIENTATION=- /assembly_acc=CAM_ASM_000147